MSVDYDRWKANQIKLGRWPRKEIAMVALFRVTTTKTTFELTAHSYGAAASIACRIEECPERSILKIELVRVLD